MRYSPVLLLALPLLLSACSKDPPVGPSTPSTTQPTAATVIGASGGTLACDGFSLLIPPSAFSSAESLSVTRETYGGYFGSCDVTNQYRLNGLPRDFSGKIQIALECTRAPSRDLVLGVGTDGVALQSGESRILYDIIPATFDSGFVKAALRSDTLTGSFGKAGGVRDDLTGTAKYFNTATAWWG